MWRELKITLPDDIREIVASELYDLGCQGIMEFDGGLFAYFTEEADDDDIMWALSGYDGLDVSSRMVDEQDWYSSWKESVVPFQAAGFTICPPWSDYVPAPGEMVLVLDPGQAFGTGDHVTTLTVIMALKEWVDAQPSLSGKRFLDLGTGTGIISIAAALWGVEDITAVDNEEPAIETAAANFASNDLDDGVRLLKGSITDAGQGYDFIAANIFQDALIELMPDTAKALNDGGTLAVSGLLAGQEEKVIIEAGKRGLKTMRTIPASGWVSVIFEK